LNGTWNLSEYSSISLWAKCNETASFSITLRDSSGETRTFWSIKVGDSSATAAWKRFVVNLHNYTSQTAGFNISMVDCIELYVSSHVAKHMSFWVDDLTVDTSVALEKAIYKDRVPVNEMVVIYFYIDTECGVEP
jgi:hypothetical protein